MFYSVGSYSIYKVNPNVSGGTPTPPSFADTTSFYYDGVDDFLTGTTTYSELNGQNKATFSLWVKPTSISQQIFLGLAQSSGTMSHLILYASGLLRMTFQNSGYYVNANTTSITANQWNHILVCFDKTEISSLRGRIFVNGIDQTSGVNLNNVSYGISTTPLSIGAYPTGSNLSNSVINEVAIWSGVDLRNNVQEIWNSGLPNNLNNLPTAPQPTTWIRSENGTWNGTAWLIGDENSDYEMRDVNMVEANRENDVPYLYSNKSFTFDGVDDSINVGATPLNLRFNRLDTFSISAWVKVDTSQNNVIVSNQLAPSTNYRGYYFAVNNSNQVIVILRSTLSDRLIFTSTTTITNGVWNHIVFTYDGTATTTGGNIYINNSLDTLTRTGTLTGTMESIDVFYIGCRSNADNFMDGTIDEVSIFDSELTQTDVNDIFANGVPSALPNPISHWRMGEDATWNGTDWTLTDNGSGGNNGTSQNMVLASRTNDVPLFNTKSILFDGVDDRIDLASRTQNFTDFSLSFWVVWGGGNYKTIVGSSTANQGGILWGIVQAGGQIRYFDATSGWTNLSGGIADGLWHHILITYDSSATTIKGYKDGTLAVTKTNVNVNNPTNAHSFDQIGARQNVGLYNQKLDEIAVWDSIIDISDVWDGSNKPTNLSSTNPIHWWRMGDYDSYPTLIDRGSGNNNGTMTNMTSASIVDDVPE